jgi:hypothetical protein
MHLIIQQMHLFIKIFQKVWQRWKHNFWPKKEKIFPAAANTSPINRKRRVLQFRQIKGINK